MMIITPNSRVRKVKGEYGRIWGKEVGNADYEGMVVSILREATGLYCNIRNIN